jgi:adenylosuccinate synthase
MHGQSDSIIAKDLVGDVDLLKAKICSQQERKRFELDAFRGLEHPAAVTAWALLDDVGLASRAIEAWSPLRTLSLVDSQAAVDIVVDAQLPIFEGAQGVLLDEIWGFHPHTTWGDCTLGGALSLLGERPFRSLGLTRTVTCRHGAGPLPGYRSEFDALVEPHNTPEGWQGAFRKGALDLVLLRYALDVLGHIDGLAINHMDWVTEEWPVIIGHRVDGEVVERLPIGELDDEAHRTALGVRLERTIPVIRSVYREELLPLLESVLRLPVLVTSDGPTADHRTWRSAYE